MLLDFLSVISILLKGEQDSLMPSGFTLSTLVPPFLNTIENMKKYENNSGIIYLGDSREIIKNIPDKSIDCIITDPPYGVSFKKKGEPYMIGDHINPMPLMFPEIYRVLKDDGAIFMFTSMSYLTESFHQFQTYFKLHNIIIWDKINPIYPRSKAHFRLQYEPILYGSKGLHNLQNKKCGDIIKCGIPRGKVRFHPTQKPEGVIEEIIKSLLPSKMIFFDPFMGSGTVPAVCKKMGKQFIGIEIQEKYVEKAIRRLEQEVLF